MNQKPGMSETLVELLNKLTNALVVAVALCVGVAVIAGVLWAFYMVLVLMEALS